eukprot:scaffold35882_cov79-Isochrysis_galbana.AAC.1
MVPPPAMSAGACPDYGYGGYGGMGYPGYACGHPGYGGYGCGYGDGAYGCVGYGGGGYGGAAGFGAGAGGGGGGGGYGPYRAMGDVSGVDVRQVEALLAEREELRRARNFDAADEVRQSLMALGVR